MQIHDFYRVYLPGEARSDKGIDVFIKMIELLVNQNKSGKFEFVLQLTLNNNDSRSCLISKIQGLAQFSKITIIGSLDSIEYYKQISLADIILLPYKVYTSEGSEGYSARTSGIFSEAVIASKPLIVTKPTWMSFHLKEMQSGIAVNDSSEIELMEALLKITNDFKTYKNNAEKASKKWADTNNSEVFCKSFLKAIK